MPLKDCLDSKKNNNNEQEQPMLNSQWSICFMKVSLGFHCDISTTGASYLNGILNYEVK